VETPTRRRPERFLFHGFTLTGPASAAGVRACALPRPSPEEGEKEVCMNAPRFSVHVDQDGLAEQDLATALRPAQPGTAPGREQPIGADAHHGAHDSRQAARGRSEKDHARTAGAGKARSYAFRRS
jgi:hypothetical protein